jgi:hypothetical protein
MKLHFVELSLEEKKRIRSIKVMRFKQGSAAFPSLAVTK